jgi:hypothetical protein
MLLVATIQQILGSSLKAFFTQHIEAKRVNEAICRVECKTDRQRIFNLARRGARAPAQST